MDEQRTVFSLTEEESKTVNEFKKKHRKCSEIFHDLSGAQFTYNFIPTGLGTAITVECSCGEYLSMGDFLDDKTIREHKLKRYTQDEITEKIIRNLNGIRKRPGVYFGSIDFRAFWFWLRGISFFMDSDFDPPILWSEIRNGIEKQLMFEYHKSTNYWVSPQEVIEETGSNQAAFGAWFDIYDSVLSKYPHLKAIKDE